MTTPAPITYEITQLIPAPPGTFAVFCTATTLWLELAMALGVWREELAGDVGPALRRAGPLRLVGGAFVPAAADPACVGFVSGPFVDVAVVRDGKTFVARSELDAREMDAGVGRLEVAVRGRLVTAGAFGFADVLTSAERRVVGVAPHLLAQVAP